MRIARIAAIMAVRDGNWTLAPFESGGGEEIRRLTAFARLD
jgi:hypothetical protein